MAATEESEAIAPNATVYVNNLETKVKIPALIESLREVFSEYGTIIDIVAKKSLKRKGQAFIVFETVEAAENAITDLNGFELAGKEMKCQFAKTKSDETVKRAATEQEFEEHKRERIEARERKEAADAAKSKKRPAGDDGAANKPKAARLVEDRAPPSNVLVVQGVPEDQGEEAMAALFRQYPTFKEYNPVPFRKGLGFAHYETVDGASAARAALQGLQIGDSYLTLSYRAA